MRLALLSTDDRENRRCYGVPNPIVPTPQAALLQGLEKQPDCEVHFISCVQEQVNAPKKLGANIYYHALRVPKIGWMRTGYQGCIRAVRRKLHEISPDIVHGQGTERDCAMSAVFSGYPNVITIHGNMRLLAQLHRARPPSFLWCSALLERLTLPRTDGVICITEYTREAVKSLAPKTWIIPNAVDDKLFEVERVRDEKYTVLCVAAIVPRKNQNRLMQALDHVKRPEGFELLFFGHAEVGDPYADAFLKLVRERPWCRYGGFADRETLRGHFARARGLVLPSLEDNCPMVVLEAMAAKVPVAASAVGGTPELIVDGKTGILFDPHSTDAIAAAMTRLFNGPPLTEAARREAEERFHPDVVAQQHVDVYREVLTRRQRGSP